MGDCKYCGKPAGLLRSKHSECEKQYLHASKEKENGSRKIVDEAEQAITITSDYDAFETKIAAIEASIGLTAEERKWLLIEGWENAVDQLLDNGILAEEKEKHLLDFARRFSLPDSDYKGTDAFMRIVKSAVLRDISNGLGIRGL